MFSTEYIPTLRAGRFGIKVIEIEETDKCVLVGMLNSGVYAKMHDIGRRVYSQDGISPTIHTMGGGNLEPKILIPQATKQGSIECEIGGVVDLAYPNSKTRRGRVQDGGRICPTITAESNGLCRIEPQVLTPKRTEHGKAVRKAYESGEHQESRHTMTELEPRDDGVTNTLTTVQKDNLVIERTERVRKLTPRECWRLMGFTDEDFDNAKQALNETFYKGKDRSNSQLYKQAGNSIVVDVLEHIFEQMKGE